MSQNFRSYCFAALAALVVLPSCAEERIFAEEAAQTQPPTLVKCRDEATCDRKPEHLETFVTQFYEWYVNRVHENRSALRGVLPKERVDIEHHQYESDEQIFTLLFSHEFRRYYDNGKKAYDGDASAILCADSDDDLVICSLYPSEKWLGEISAHLWYVKGIISFVHVSFPVSQESYSTSTVSAHEVDVRLKAVNGFWRIDRVTDLWPEIRGGK
jgi:hypothetical protein